MPDRSTMRTRVVVGDTFPARNMPPTMPALYPPPPTMRLDSARRGPSGNAAPAARPRTAPDHIAVDAVNEMRPGVVSIPLATDPPSTAPSDAPVHSRVAVS